MLHVVKRLDEEGIRLAVGSDAGTMYMSPGDSTHLEMALMREAGLSHATVLRAATLTAAETLGIEDRYGTAEIGRIADLVVVDANPLEDLGALQQPRAVIKAGQWISSEELKKLKESGENPSGFYVSLGRLLEDLLSRKLH